MTRDLEGRIALVTGGTRGIGRAISCELANRGANVVMGYFRNTASARETVASIEGLGVKASAIKAHVGDPDQLARMFDEVTEQYGRLDVFVSNAASGVIQSLTNLDMKSWRWTMNTNARAFFLGLQRASALMDSGGSVIALSSGGAARVLPGYSAVGASKASIETLVRYAAVELAASNVRVNAVSPGVVDTDALRHFPMREQMLERALATTPAGRLVTPADVASLVGFLVSDEASMITGQTLVVDGGAGLVA
jgi:enoyl-[acyl-carrier protein] reductase III